MRHGPVRLVVPEGALVAPTAITLVEIAGPLRGALGPGYEFGPDGLAFARPATLEVLYDGLRLPVGTESGSLRLAVLDAGRWVPIEEHVNSTVDMRVAGIIRHFSTYGVVPDPREVSGRGTRWEANGIAVDASEEMFGRLFVSPTAVSLFLGGEAAGPVAITFSGLPTDDDNHLYADGYDGGVVVAPADGGVATLTVDGRSPHYLWLQPRPGTTLIGGPADECRSVGVRSGTTCTLTRDIVAGVSIEAGGETLDCAGHRIYQPLEDRGTGIGVLVGGLGPAGPLDDVTIRNCVLGGPDAGFWEGLAATGTNATHVLDSTFSDNIVGAFFAGATNARVAGNRFDGEGNVGIQMYEGSSDGEIAGNAIALVPGIDPIGMMFKGMEGKLGPLPTTRMTVDRNTIAGGDVGIGFVLAEGNSVLQNDIDGPDRGLWIGAAGLPNRFWWNNVAAASWGVWAEIGPAELSDAGRGNHWGHSCSGALFTPGVDSNRADVRDSHAYGSRDAWLGGEVPGCAGDADGDTVPDAADNCPAAPNPGQENEDGVGEGDACDVTAPDAPTITAPDGWAVLASGSFAVGGTAERRSVVTVTDFGAPVGEARADDGGVFSFVAVPPWGEGVHHVGATARDAAGNASSGSDVVPVLVDVSPPAPPSIETPRFGEVVATRFPQVTGTAEAGCSVRVWDGALLIGETAVGADGAFALVPAAPLSDGDHVLAAVATDGAGWMSARSPEVAFRVLAPSPSTPVVSPRARLSVIGLSDAPDPFDPVNETAALRATVEVAPVAGLGGASPNHRFEVRAEWSVRTAEDPPAAVTSAGSSVAVEAGPGSGGVAVVIDANAEWDGTDAAGETVVLGRTYGYDLGLVLLRVWIGPGLGPRCGRDEEPVTTGAGSPACVLERLAIPDAGTIFVQHEPFRSGSGQVLRALRMLRDDHERSTRAWVAQLGDDQRESYLALVGEIGDDPLELRVRFSRDGTVRGAAAFDMRIPVGGSDPATAARAAVVRYRNLFGLETPQVELGEPDVRGDGSSGWHVHFRQRWSGFPVFGCSLVVHLLPSLELAGVAGLLLPPDRITRTTFAIGEADALRVAMDAGPPGATYSGSNVAAGVFAAEAFAGDAAGGEVAYRVRLAGAESEWSRQVLVAGADGRVLSDVPLTDHSIDVKRVVYTELPGECPPDGLVWQDDPLAGCVRDGLPYFPGTSQSLVRHLGTTLAYFAAPPFLRDGWDGCGSPLVAYADSPVGVSGWTPDGTITSACLPPSTGHVDMRTDQTCLDVVAHEVTHSLQDKAEWGAATTEEVGILEEALSDVFSQLVETASDGNSDWVVGGGAGGVGCTRVVRDVAWRHEGRSLGDPGTCSYPDGPYPDNYSNYLSFPGSGVHYDSTIVSAAGYLLAREPARGPATHWGVAVTGVGAAEAGRVWYGVMAHALSRTPTLREFGEAVSLPAWFSLPAQSVEYVAAVRSIEAIGLWSSAVDSGIAARWGVAKADRLVGGGREWCTFGVEADPLAFRHDLYATCRTWGFDTWWLPGFPVKTVERISDATGTPVAVNYSGEMWVFWRDIWGRIRYSRSAGFPASWGAPETPDGGPVTDADFGAAVYDGGIDVVYRTDASHMYLQRFVAGAGWAPAEPVDRRCAVCWPIATGLAAAATVDGPLWIAYGLGWGENARLTFQSFRPADGWSVSAIAGPQPGDGPPECPRDVSLAGMTIREAPSLAVFRGRLHAAGNFWRSGEATPRGVYYASCSMPCQSSLDWTRWVNIAGAPAEPVEAARLHASGANRLELLYRSPATSTSFAQRKASE